MTELEDEEGDGESTALVLAADRALALVGLPLGKIARALDVADGPRFRRALWCALQELRKDDQLEFRIEDGRLVQITEPVARLKRSRRFVSTAARKRLRALDVLRAIPLDGCDDKVKASVVRAEERLARRCAIDRLALTLPDDVAPGVVAYVATLPRGKPKT